MHTALTLGFMAAIAIAHVLLIVETHRVRPETGPVTGTEETTADGGTNGRVQ